MKSHNSKFSSVPPKSNNEEEVRSKFIAGAKAEKLAESSEVIDSNFPWNNPRARNDLKVPFTVQLPETYILKLKYISAQTRKSQQSIFREIVMPQIDKILELTLRGKLGVE